MTNDGATGYERILEDISGWIQDCRSFPEVSRARAKLLEDAAAIEAKRERLLAPLLIVLAGGTGVGKSSLLNALAGAAITSTSATRAHTRDYTCYHHEDDALALAREVVASGSAVAHSREELRDKIIVDAPDFDSAELANREKLIAALRNADLVLWVTTSQKYANLTGVRTLAEFREGRGFVFVLNRDDEGIPDSVVEDYRRLLTAEGFFTGGPAGQDRIFRVSAVGALARKQGDDQAEAGRDDAALEAFLETQLDKKRIRILKSGNLAALVLRLIDRVRQRIPGGLRATLDQWRGAGDQHYLALREQLRQRLSGAVIAQRGFVRQLRYRFAAGYSGLFGAWLQFVYALRAIADLDYPDLFSGRDETKTGPRVPRGQDALANDQQEVLELHRRIETAGRQLGLAAEVTRTRPEDAAIERGLRRFYDRVDAGFLHELDEVDAQNQGLSPRLQNLLLNLIPGAWLLFTLLAWLHAHFPVLEWLGVKADAAKTGAGLVRGASDGYFTAAFLIALLILFIGQRLAEKSITRRVDAVLERADAIVNDAVDATLQADIMRARDERIAATTRELDALDGLEHRATILQRGRVDD